MGIYGQGVGWGSVDRKLKGNIGVGDSGQMTRFLLKAGQMKDNRGWAVRNFIRYQRWGMLTKLTQWAKGKAQGQGLLRKWARRT